MHMVQPSRRRALRGDVRSMMFPAIA